MKKIFLLMIFVLVFSATVYGAETAVQLARVADTSEGLYRYEYPDGTGFVSTVLNGESDAPISAFDFDPGVSWTLFKDGTEYGYTNNQILSDSGSYSLRVWTSDNVAEIFAFSIKNESFSMPDFDNYMFRSAVTDAELTLKAFSNAMFVYAFENGVVFSASVPRGGTADTAVTLEFEDSVLQYTVYCDGKPIDAKKSFDKPGVYDITFISRTNADTSLIENPTLEGLSSPPSATGGVYVAGFHFRILTPRSNVMGIYNAPQDFIITGVMHNGVPAEFCSSHARLREDGYYSISLRCALLPLVTAVNIYTDTTAPILNFSTGLGGITYDNVEIYAPQDCTLSVTRSGEEYTVVDNILSRTGAYQITATDAVGNSRVYRIHIMYGLQATPERVITLLAFAVAVFAVLWVATRRNLNVR